MKFTTTFFFIISMVLMVSCGGSSSKGSGSSNSSSLNPYGVKVQTINAYYTPTKQYMVFTNNRWYSLQPYGSNGQDIQNLQQVTSQAILSGQSQYPLQVIRDGSTYVTVFRVRIVGIVQPTTTTTTNTSQVASGVIGVQSIQLY